MSDRGHHCPFLNRADSRCAENFSLDHLGHAFNYCFGYYDACTSYRQLLAERQARRAAGPGPFNGNRITQLEEDAEFEAQALPPRTAPVVQLTVGGRGR